MNMQTLTALALAIMMAMLGLATFATAQLPNGVDDVITVAADTIGGAKDKEHKDGDGKHIYVALGTLGDVLVSCPGINGIESVTVNPPVGNPVTVTFGDGGQVPVETGVNSNGQLCFGGASANMPEASTSAWDVWITDLVWDRVLDETILQDDVFKVAGFARMDIGYEYQTLTKDTTPFDETCMPVDDDGETPVVCLQPGVGTWSYTRTINNFGFCGQGVINTSTGYLDPWAEMNSNSALPGALGDRTNKTAQKVVFIDGAHTFLFDCNQGANAIEGGYNDVVGIGNMVTCSGGNPLPSIVCLFDLPAGQSVCMADVPANIPVPGLIGTIGWRHDDDSSKCHETAFHQDANVFEGNTIAVKNLPGCEATNDLKETCKFILKSLEETLSTHTELEIVCAVVGVSTPCPPAQAACAWTIVISKGCRFFKRLSEGPTR